ncbi:unnamed protein product [Closterium sp. NIES-54]
MPDDGKSSVTGVAVLNWSDPRLQEEQASKDTGCEQGVRTGDAKGVGIVEFLRGKHILVTGATGFLAKALVEKILREQPDVGRLYLFIQPRADQPAQQRLEQLVASPIFGHLRLKHGSAYEQFMAAKLGAVEGDISREGLGLSPSVLEEIRSKVQVVINSAATTTFDERYDVALNVNTQGPRRLLELAHSCPDLQLLLHVSTAFVNGRRRGRCMERPFNYGDTIAAELQQHHSTVAQRQLDIETEIALAEKERLAAEAAAEARGMSKEDVQAAVQKHMVDLGMSRAQQCGWQDTYVFTKAMGEMVLTRGHKDLPLAIVRPSIVESCLIEPMAGWMEGMRMADPILLAYGKGQMAGFLANPDGVLDMVPCDKVINAVLAIATHTAYLGHGAPVSVYHVATSVANPLGIQLVADATSDHFAHSPMLQRDGSAVTVQRMQVFRHPQLFMLDVWLKYQLPLQLAKLFPWNSSLSDRRNNLLLKTAQQLSYLGKLYEPYTFYAARFDASNTERLFSLMSEEEQQHFNFDLRSIDWHAYLSGGATGTRGARGAGPGGARTGGTGAAGAGGVVGHGAGDLVAAGAGAGDPGAGGASAGGAGAVGTCAGGTVQRRPFFVPLLRQVLSLPSSTGLTPPLLCPPPDQSQPQLQPDSPLRTPSLYTEQSDSLTEQREPESRPASPIHASRIGPRVPCARPPPIPGTHSMAIRPIKRMNEDECIQQKLGTSTNPN